MKTPTSSTFVLIPLIFIAGVFAASLLKKKWEFQRACFWCFKQDQFFVGKNKHSLKPVQNLQVEKRLPFFTVLCFSHEGQHQRHMLVPDRVDHESFRQFRVMLLLAQQDIADS